MSGLTVMILAWVFCIGWSAFVIMTQKNVHPKALFYLFFVELWERFSYYGMRALLVLYMVAEIADGGFGFSEEKAYGIYASYGAMVYATPLIGGYLAEKFLGYRKAIMWGAILMALGHFAMAFENNTIFLTALGLLILGNGFFKPNISSLIGKYYGLKDPRRDGAFTIFYMGINIGAFLTPLTCGYLGQTYGWHIGFGIAGIGMVIGLIIFMFAARSGALGDKGLPPGTLADEDPSDVDGIPNVFEDDHLIDSHLTQEQEGTYDLSPGEAVATPGVTSRDLIIYGCTFLALPILFFLINHNEILDYTLPVLIGGAWVALLGWSFTREKVEGDRLRVLLIMFFFPVIFWTFFELAGSALTIFTLKNVSMPSWLTAASFQSVNPFFIMLFAPVFSWLWIRLSQRNMEPSAPVKFAIGLVLLGSGFLVLNLGVGMSDGAKISWLFMVALYFLHTMGELALSPVGLSLVTKLSPMKVVGLVMGFWMMTSSLAHLVGGWIAKYTAVPDGTPAEESLRVSMGVFNQLGFFAIGAGVLLFLLSFILKKWMHGVK